MDYIDLEIRVIGEYGNRIAPIDVYKTADVYVTARYKDQYVTSKRFTYTLPEAEITSSYASGSYNNIINIELDCNIPSYDLYYTTNGKDPAVNGILYSEPIELDDTTNLRVAAKYRSDVIAEESFNYTLNLEYVTVNVPSGHYSDKIEVELTPSNPFYDIYYTTDGSSPKTNGIKYNAPIEITESAVIKAVPVLGNTYGKTSSFEYTIGSEVPEPSEGISADNYIIRKLTDGQYMVFFDVNSTLTNSKPADVYLALYDGKGALREVKKYVSEFSTGLNNINLTYTTDFQLQPDNYFKIMCWERDTICPIFEKGLVSVGEIK